MKKIFLWAIVFCSLMMFAGQTNAAQTTFQKNYNTLNKYFKAFNDCRVKNNLPKLKASYIAVKENTNNANNLVIFKIKKLRTAYLDCKTKACPDLIAPTPDFCKDGKIISGGIDSKGCALAPKCEKIEPVVESGKGFLNIIGSANITINKNQGVTAVDSDSADFSIDFKIQAGSKDIYINDQTAANPGLVLKTDNGITSLATCQGFDGVYHDVANKYFIVYAGQKGTISCSTHIIPTEDQFVVGYLSDFLWGIDSTDTTQFHWTPDGANNTVRFDIMSYYKSESIYLDKRP